MLYRVFGKTGWRISHFGVGCWQFGGAITLDGKPDGWTGVNDDESLATIQRAVELGINFFDTANMYGWGHSEEILGRALKDLPASNGRNKIRIATKVGFWHDNENRRTYVQDRNEILRACEDSLRRLQVECIDLYQCHLWRTEYWTEFLEAFEQLTREGKIRFYGVSTNDFDMVRRFDERKQLCAVQSNFNLLDRRALEEILPYCRARGIAFIARGPLASGKLSGRLSANTQFEADDIRNRWLADDQLATFRRDLAIVDRLKPIAQRCGFSLPQLAMKYIQTHVAVSTTIVGVKNRQQLEEHNAGLFLSPLTADELSQIEYALKPVESDS